VAKDPMELGCLSLAKINKESIYMKHVLMAIIMNILHILLELEVKVLEPT